MLQIYSPTSRGKFIFKFISRRIMNIDPCLETAKGFDYTKVFIDTENVSLEGVVVFLFCDFGGTDIVQLN